MLLIGNHLHMSTIRKNILVPLADGYNEIYTAAIVGVFRAADYVFHVASIENKLTLKSIHGMNVVADRHITNCNWYYDAFIFLGDDDANRRMRDNVILKRKVTETK